MAGTKRTQRVEELIGGMNNPPTTEEAGTELTIREAMLPAKLRDWRAKLSAKAKQEKRYCFYSLYGLVSHPETLRAAWAQVRANGGKAGVDGISIEQIEREGEEAFLEELVRELVEKTYRTGAVRRAYILKDNGKVRPLGILNLRDRVVQAAVLLILGPIFESDFLECSTGFDPDGARTTRWQSSGKTSLQVVARFMTQTWKAISRASRMTSFWLVCGCAWWTEVCWD